MLMRTLTTLPRNLAIYGCTVTAVSVLDEHVSMVTARTEQPGAARVHSGHHDLVFDHVVFFEASELYCIIPQMTSHISNARLGVQV